MKIERLITMANQIGTFFEAAADFEAGADDVAGHLKRFWDPRMRDQLLEHLEEEGPDGLLPIVVTGLRRNRNALSGGRQVIHEEARWVGQDGASDAG